jgi:hypothetical protein
VHTSADAIADIRSPVASNPIRTLIFIPDINLFEMRLSSNPKSIDSLQLLPPIAASGLLNSPRAQSSSCNLTDLIANQNRTRNILQTGLS